MSFGSNTQISEAAVRSQLEFTAPIRCLHLPTYLSVAESDMLQGFAAENIERNKECQNYNTAVRTEHWKSHTITTSSSCTTWTFLSLLENIKEEQ
jgi:hypothetical protein